MNSYKHHDGILDPPNAVYISNQHHLVDKEIKMTSSRAANGISTNYETSHIDRDEYKPPRFPRSFFRLRRFGKDGREFASLSNPSSILQEDNRDGDEENGDTSEESAGPVDAECIEHVDREEGEDSACE